MALAGGTLVLGPDGSGDFVVDAELTGGLAGATGRVDFKDIIGDPITYVYRDHNSLR